MESLSFSDDEIKKQLSALGYYDVSEDRLKQFRKDLNKLIEHDRSTTGSSSWFTGVSSPTSNSGQSEFSETSDKNPTVFRSSMKPHSLSRFQPHLQVEPRRSPPRLPPNLIHDSMHHDSEMSQLSMEDQVTPPAPHSVEASHHPSTEPSQWTDHFTDTTMDSDRSQTPDGSISSQKVIRKRKVLRKEIDGTPRVYNESLVEDNNRMYRIQGRSLDDSDPSLSRVSPHISLPPRPNTARPMIKDHYRSVFEEFTNKQQPPSFIRPNTSNPHTRNLKKVDPVNKYHQYKELWSNVKAPGEKSHKALRWEVKAQMMYKEEPAPRPQRVYAPNTYVVPTSKKRSALRWEARHAMERGLPIPTAYDVY